MPHIPASVNTDPIPGLKLLRRGKVRDTYEIPGHPNLLFIHTTARISVFDFVLNRWIHSKGAVLNLLDIHLRREMAKPDSGMSDIPHDLVAWGKNIADYLPFDLGMETAYHLTGRVVKKLDMLNAEIICRGRLTGSAYKTYQKGSPICGQKLPKGIIEWGQLSPPMFTPSTKAKKGHDKPMRIETFRRRFGTEPETLAKRLFCWLHGFYTDHGYEFIDFKVECGHDPESKVLTLGDELGTLDSSRLITRANLQAVLDGSISRPPSPDKQPVRDWVKAHLGIGPDSEINAKNLSIIDDSELPGSLINMTSSSYEQFFRRITGYDTGEYLDQFGGLQWQL